MTNPSNLPQIDGLLRDLPTHVQTEVEEALGAWVQHVIRIADRLLDEEEANGR